MSRSINSLTIAKAKIAELRSEFWENLLISGGSNTLNRELELAGRVADFLELGELMADDALARNES
jgi:succinate dehydrogenase / fumarate reductase flavoprotein subunit